VSKLEQTRSYAKSAGGILVSEVEEAFVEYGESAFAEELLYPTDTLAQLEEFQAARPFYETHGEKQVAAGYYKDVIRYREHIAPIARTLLG